MNVVGEGALEVGSDVGSDRGAQFQSPGAVAEVTVGLFGVGHGAAVLHPSENESCGDVQVRLHVRVGSGSGYDHVESTGTVGRATGPL